MLARSFLAAYNANDLLSLSSARSNPKCLILNLEKVEIVKRFFTAVGAFCRQAAGMHCHLVLQPGTCFNIWTCLHSCDGTQLIAGQHALVHSGSITKLAVGRRIFLGLLGGFRSAFERHFRTGVSSFNIEPVLVLLCKMTVSVLRPKRPGQCVGHHGSLSTLWLCRKFNAAQSCLCHASCRG